MSALRQAFCSKFLIHYRRPLSTDVCHRKQVPLGQRDKKKKQKRTKMNLKMFHCFQQCIIKYSHITYYHSEEHFLSFHMICILC